MLPQLLQAVVSIDAPKQRRGQQSPTAQQLHDAGQPALHALLTAVLEVPAAAEVASPADCAVHAAAADALLTTQRTSSGLLSVNYLFTQSAMHVR